MIFLCKESDGKILTDSYRAMEDHKTVIRLNSIAGPSSEIIYMLLISYAICKVGLPWYYIFSFIIPLLGSLLSTLLGCKKSNNDFYIFRHPEQFKYNPDVKK